MASSTKKEIDQVLEQINSREEKILDLTKKCDETSIELDIKSKRQINNYKIIKHGGYLRNEIDCGSFFHKNYKNTGQIRIEKDTIINTINCIQKVAFKINYKVLYYILKSIINKIDLGKDLYFTKHKDSHRLSEFASNETDKKKNIEKITEIVSYNSIYLLNLSTLTAAILFRKTEFYQPTFIDWRGRIYTTNTILSFQGNELTRSLLMFSKGDILTEAGVLNLKHYITACFGKGKLSKNSQLHWFNENESKIIDIDSYFWLEAKDKLMFLSAALEYRDYLKDPNNYISYLPIYIDATCSGLQHLASMTSDFNLAKYVNLLESSNEEAPFDVYQKMAEEVTNKIISLSNTDDSYSIFLLLIINRLFVKRAIMTIPYGVTIQGIKEQLIEEFFVLTGEQNIYLVTTKKQTIKKATNIYKLKDKSFLIDPNQEFKITGTKLHQLAKLIHSTLYQTFPNLTVLINYLQDINSFLNKINLNIGIVWLTPNGLIIEQKYMETKKNVLTISILNKRKSLVIKEKINKISKRRQSLAIVPNLIHSMDAATISLLCETITKNFGDRINLITIHDCFATNANHVGLIDFHVKASFLKIYQDQDFVDKFHSFLLTYLNNLGFSLNEDKTLLLTKPTIAIPQKAVFNKALDLKNGLYKSKYFLIF